MSHVIRLPRFFRDLLYEDIPRRLVAMGEQASLEEGSLPPARDEERGEELVPLPLFDREGLL